ncbi:MAG: hypothetical protein ACTSPY_16930 [Candidatus Helarchaeota archaeon]
MAGEAIWDGWEEWTQKIYQWAFILTLIGTGFVLFMGIWVFFWYSLISPLYGFSILISNIIYCAIGIVGAILYYPISKQIKENDYENINLVKLIISAVLAAIGAWYFAILQELVALFICFLSEYGWIAKNK